MAVQETIAFIGGAGNTCPVLMKKMARENLRLLFISKNGNEEVGEFVQQLEAEKGPDAEIEVVNCLKDSCWEADIIAFIDPETIEEELVNKMKEVATQKAVLFITVQEADSQVKCTGHMKELEALLPHSNIVMLRLDSAKLEASLMGKNQDALEAVSQVMRKCGYSIQVQDNRRD